MEERKLKRKKEGVWKKGRGVGKKKIGRNKMEKKMTEMKGGERRMEKREGGEKKTEIFLKKKMKRREWERRKCG